MPRPSRATAHHFVEIALTQTPAPSRASGFVQRPKGDPQLLWTDRSPCADAVNWCGCRGNGVLLESGHSLARVPFIGTYPFGLTHLPQGMVFELV